MPGRVGKDSHSAALTQDFAQEFEAQTASLLSRRFLWFSGLVGSVGLLMTMIALTVGVVYAFSPGPPAEVENMTVAGSPNKAPAVLKGTALAAISTAAYLGSFFYAKRRRLQVSEILRLSFALVIFDGLLHILATWLKMPVSLGMWGVLITHVLACSFLPWTVTQCLRPFVILWIVHALKAVMTERYDMGDKILSLTMSALACGPGVLICWLRHSHRLESYRLQFLQQRYGEVRRELVDARRIHESMFPKEVTDGPVQLRYAYEPMRQIGGDYLFAWREPSAEGGAGRFNLVLMDVTGHGIAAALTVNRLHGELQRVYAEDPEIHPGEVLRLMNRYVNLTLAQHSVFLTAMCLRVDIRRDLLEFASGGHPPAYLRAVDGTIHQLAATAVVLGACADAQFDSHAQSVRFGPGDRLIAYTDGAIEARSPEGKMLGMVGLQRLLAGGQPDADRGWTTTLLRAVEAHRQRPAEDDTLVIEVSRPVGVQPPSTPGGGRVTPTTQAVETRA